MKLLTHNNTKILKGVDQGYMTYGLHFAPSTLSGRNVCPNASPGCAEACLNTAGRGVMQMVQDARIKKTKKFFENKLEFAMELSKDVARAINYTFKKQMNVCFRLNLTSDIEWERYGIIEDHPAYQFYDYTKSLKRMFKFLRKEFPHNYHLTYSRSEITELKTIRQILDAGGNVAVVFDEVPKTWEGMEVISGDEHDLRFKDPRGKIVGLEAKGKAKQDDSGFVVKVGIGLIIENK